MDFLKVLNPYRSTIGEDHPLWKKEKIDKILKLFIGKIDELEKYRVNIGSNTPHSDIKIDYSSWIKCVKEALSYLKKENSYPVVTASLKQRLCGMLYRISGKYGGEDSNHQIKELESSFLYEKLGEWKKLPSQFNLKSYEITQKDKNKLNKLERYLSFAETMRTDSYLRDRVFHWITRLNGDVDLLIQFPALADKMMRSRVQDCIGYIDHDLIQVVEHEGIKDVWMKYRDDQSIKTVSILDEKEVIILEKGLNLSIEEIFQDIKDKKKIHQRRVCFFYEGLENWDSHHLAKVDREGKIIEYLDVKSKGWWKKLPIEKKITQEEAQNRFGRDFDGKKNFAALSLHSARATRDVDVQETHAWNGFCFRIEGEEGYALHHFGYMGDVYPQNTGELVNMLFQYVSGVYSFPEESTAYTEREETWTTTLLDFNAFNDSVMPRVSRDIERGRTGQLPFQLFLSACSKKAKKIYNIGRQAMDLDPIEPYKIHFTKIDAKGFIKILLFPTACMPTYFRNYYLYFIFLAGQPWKEKEFEIDGEKKVKSCWKNKNWSQKITESPSMLFRMQEEGRFLPLGEIKPGHLTDFKK